MKQYTIVESLEEYQKIGLSPVFLVNNAKVYLEIIQRILERDDYYEIVFKWFSDDVDVLSISSGDNEVSYEYYKMHIVRGIELYFQYIVNSQQEISDEWKKRYLTLKKMVDYSLLKDKYQFINYEIDVDNIHYSINVLKMLKIIELPRELFVLLCRGKNELIGDMPKNHFLYAIKLFLEDERILKRFLVPQNVIDNYNDLVDSVNVDLEALNKYLITVDTLYQKVSINEELYQALIEGTDGLTILEKAIYIYIKMCRLLTYNEEYYAFNQQGKVSLKHQDINYIQSINLTNNEVVCFEFNLIYSFILNKLGINFKSNYLKCNGEEYGKGHVNMCFRCGKYLISIDPCASIITSDMMQAKLNQPLSGIKCFNQNSQTRQEFQHMVMQIYKLFDKRKHYNFNDLISQKSFYERLQIFFERVNSINLKGIDGISYFFYVRSKLFNSEERSKMLPVSIIRNDNTKNKLEMVLIILTVISDKNMYYCYSPQNGLIVVELEDLQRMFDLHIFNYIGSNKPKIPGIIEREISSDKVKVYKK